MTFLLLSYSVKAQPPLTGAEPPRNVIKLAPLAFLHGQMPFTVESRIGYERVLGRKTSVGASYSYLGSNPVFGFIGSAALSATLTTALTLYGKPGKGGIVWSETKIQTSGYRYQLQFRKYLGSQTSAPEGWYLSPHYSFARTNYNIAMKDFELDFKLKAKNESLNLLLGYQAILGRHFVLDVFTGLGYRNNSQDIYDSQNVFLKRMKKSSPLKLSTGLNIGWAF
ncbi:MAG TPA: DUF3575 domain-containing protein [Adhaeribacter sp.]|nr:DUF3575 domain-containing protein [Adhaeribacter sp.]